MDTTTPAEIRDTLWRALGTHAEQMRLEAARRSNAGTALKDHRAALRAESRRATALRGIVNRVNANDLAFLLNADEA